MERVLFSILVIASGLLTGWAVRRRAEAIGAGQSPGLARLKLALQRASLTVLLPITYCGAFWNLDLSVSGIYSLPALGVFTFFAGGGLALLAGRALGLTPRRLGAFFGCGMFTNLGAVGALVCHTLLGEEGFALVPAYKLLEEVVYFGIGFPIARSFTQPGRGGVLAALGRAVTDPFILAALGGMAAGIALRLSGLPRPAGFATLNAVLVPLASFLMLVAIGISLRFARLGKFPRECAAVMAVKFVCVPALACLAALALGYGSVMGGMPLKVVMILSSMPVAFLALIPPALYDLDMDLANACWFATILWMAVQIPLLAVLVTLV